MLKKATSQPVRAQNRYALAEYPSMEAAAATLSTIGVMSSDEVLKLLRKHVGYINGFVITYPDKGNKEN